jgi:uncharacterized Zn finger protein (UPF0148 family)
MGFLPPPPPPAHYVLHCSYCGVEYFPDKQRALTCPSCGAAHFTLGEDAPKPKPGRPPAANTPTERR